MHNRILLVSLIFFFFDITYSYPLDYELIGKVESKRKDGIITLIFEEKPQKDKYLIIEENTEIGTVNILSIHSFTKNNRVFYKSLAAYSFTGKDIIKTGSKIALVKQERKEINLLKEDEKNKGKVFHKQYIITDTDYREMILIPAGKFLFGSDNEDKDEYPKQIISLDDYYIDKYEVSNTDYYSYVKKTNSTPPASWSAQPGQSGRSYNEGEDDFPVIVSYYEAKRYAEWAGKRLPTEEEWEKAARGSGLELKKQPDESYIYIEKPLVYPWGNKFDPLKANSIDFWESKNIGKDYKKKYSNGYLPVYFFKGLGDSVYGVVNMAGNASEWTDSWYSAYKGSKYQNKMFGKQVKVIRGGSWFDARDKLRVTDREYGGLPNLYEDNIAGFRCVKDPTILDEIK